MTESPQTPSTLEFTRKPGSECCKRSPADSALPCERIPHITKLLALANKFERMLAQGQVKNRTVLARTGQVSRARLTQIMHLMDLVPAIQEQILSMTCPAQAPDPIREQQLPGLRSSCDGISSAAGIRNCRRRMVESGRRERRTVSKEPGVCTGSERPASTWGATHARWLGLRQSSGSVPAGINTGIIGYTP
jgi:hypothetical protein